MTVGGRALALDVLSWPREKLGEAMHALARRSGLAPLPAVGLPPVTAAAKETLQRWVDSVALHLGVEAEPVEIRHGYLQVSLPRRAPAVLRVARDGGDRFLCVVSAGRRRAAILTSSGAVKSVPAALLHAELRAALEADELVAGARDLLARAAIAPSRHDRVQSAFFRHSVGRLVAVDGWSLRPLPGSSFARQLRLAGAPRLAAGFVALQTLRSAGWVLSWWLLGRAAFGDHLDPGWFLAWVLMLGTLVPPGVWAARLEALFAVSVGGLLKRRLLDGALRLDLGATRAKGVGQLLGRAIESEGVESLLLGGGLQGVTAVLELVMAVVVAVGTGRAESAGWLLIPWILLAVAGSGLLLRRRRSWAHQRMDLTHDLVESMVGYRTRLAQEAPARWHDGEDQAMSRYLLASRSVDRVTGLLTGLIPRAWLLVGLVALLPAVSRAGAGGAADLAIGVGIVLLGHGALGRLTGGLVSLIDASIAWEQVRELFRASGASESPGLTSFLSAAAGEQPERDAPGAAPPVALSAVDLTYLHPGRRSATLRGCSLEVRAGDRILLEGPSGGGKSTLATLLAGLRTPDSGLLLVHDLDRSALGDRAWRRRVAVVPQFHENHVLAETLLFNLLMGRRWPPDPGDIEEAASLCRELGLGPLLARMPAGLHQPVGDTGWRLSHGERSRVFVARALLQGADVVIFDESFAALDPETLRDCLEAVRRRQSATLVIAHP